MPGTGRLSAGEEQRMWREALERLRALERVWPDEAAREREREACRAWLAEQRALPRSGRSGTSVVARAHVAPV
ncbi:MAG: hypothetical protein ACOX7Q_16115 [Kiritimatiellia bacterium]